MNPLGGSDEDLERSGLGDVVGDRGGHGVHGVVVVGGADTVAEEAWAG